MSLLLLQLSDNQLIEYVRTLSGFLTYNDPKEGEVKRALLELAIRLEHRETRVGRILRRIRMALYESGVCSSDG